MSDWKDNVDNVRFTITTGDGKVYTPLWRESQKNKDYNVTGFDFIDVPGTLVERKQPQGSKYPLVFWFDGADNIAKSTEFENSADDSRVWTVLHPFYGEIKGQPTSFGRKDYMNFTEITVDFWQSIDVDYPNANFSVKDNTLLKKDNVLTASENSYASGNSVTTADISKNKRSAAVSASSFENIVTDENSADFQNAEAEAIKAQDTLLSNPLNAMNKLNALLNLPSTYSSPVSERVQDYLLAYQRLEKNLETLADKFFFESQGATVIASYANASVNPEEGDYITAPEVSDVSEALLVMYNDYITILDNAIVQQDDYNESWQPDPSVQSGLNDIVTYTVGNLYVLAFDALQERVVYTDKDTNIILLVHRYLGLDASDENIESFRKTNNIVLRELFRIKKGRKIKYFV